LAGFDVFVVGGGPAGLASAIALSQKGYQVCVADCAVPPIEKACGEGLLPDSQSALRKLGVVVTQSYGAAFRGIRFQEGKRTFQAAFPNGMGVGVRRPVLQKLLIDRACQLGVQLRWGVKGLAWQEGRLTENGSAVSVALVVAADGHNSRIRRAAGLDEAKHHSWRYGYRRRYAMAPWSEHTEIYWKDRFQIYVTPVSSREVCVAVVSRQQKLRLDEALRLVPEIGQRLGGRKFSSNEMGALTVERRLKKIWRQGLALTGDASGSVDAVTGEGMGLSFKGAVALADAYSSGDLAGYQRAHEKFFERPRLMSSMLVKLGDLPLVRKRIFAGFARRPDVFGDVLATHLGMSSFFRLTPGQLLGFGIEFLSA
jgi:flavin-dependent dehydrogenase